MAEMFFRWLLCRPVLRNHRQPQLVHLFLGSTADVLGQMNIFLTAFLFSNLNQDRSRSFRSSNQFRSSRWRSTARQRSSDASTAEWLISLQNQAPTTSTEPPLNF